MFQNDVPLGGHAHVSSLGLERAVSLFTCESCCFLDNGILYIIYKKTIQAMSLVASANAEKSLGFNKIFGRSTFVVVG